jgi:glucose 1-dehydrogenase
VKGLVGKRVLVTGGTSGIGQAMAVRFAAEGALIAINYRRDEASAAETSALVQAALEECVATIRGCGARHMLVQADVSQPDQVERMVAETVAGLGGLDILINNAGIAVGAASHEMTLEQFDRVIAVNLRGAFVCAQAAIRHWLEAGQPGVILKVSSVHEVIPKPRYASYAVSKGGLGNLTRTLALEYAGQGIRVNGIGPGATVTPINRAWVDDPEKRAEVERHIPMGRAGEAAEMAAAAAFLASDEAAYITGQTLYVDGGLTLYPDFRTAWSTE